MASDPAKKATRAGPSQPNWELTLNLYRLFPVQITFPDITRSEVQQQLLQQVRDFQEEFLSKLYAFQEKFMNFHDDLLAVPQKINTAHGFKTLTVRDLRKGNSAFVKLYYDTIDALIDLYPYLPPAQLALDDHAVAPMIRQFEREANSVYVKPIQAIARGLLCDIYRIWTPEDGAIYLPAYLNVNPHTLKKQDIVQLKLQMVGRLENKAVFSDSFDPQRIAKLVNAVQGQIQGHVNRMFGLLRSDELAAYLKDSLKEIKDNFLPDAMRSVRQDFEEILNQEERVYTDVRGSQERVCLKDAMLIDTRLLFSADFDLQEDLDGAIVSEKLQQAFRECDIALSMHAVISVAEPDREWRIGDGRRTYLVYREEDQLDFYASTHLNRAYQLIARLLRLDGDEDPERIESLIQEAVQHLESFARRVRALPIGNLPRKHDLLRDELKRALSLTGEVLDHYQKLYEKVDKAINPFMGMISFTPGGTSDFYVRWFGRLKDFLDFDLQYLQQKTGDLPVAIARQAEVYLEQKNATARILHTVVTPATAAVIRYELPIADEEEEVEVEARQLSAPELVDMLAAYFCLVSYLYKMPRGLLGVERDVFYNVRKKRTFAVEVLRHKTAKRAGRKA